MRQLILLFTIYYIITTTNALIRYSDCVFEISKNHEVMYYDLSVLSQQQWEVKIGETNKYAYLSLCGKSSMLNNKLCPNKNSSVCVVEQTESNFREFIPNLGSHIQRADAENNSLIVSLDGDQQCNKSKNYSTTIHFSCSNETNVQRLASLADCKLIVNWPTIAGCPIKDPLFQKCLEKSGSNNIFDLRPLYSRNSYRINDIGRSFELNICGAVPVERCGPDNHVTACELDPITNVTKQVIGTSKKVELKLSEDGPLLVYKDRNILTKIEFICNESIAMGEPRLKSVSNNSIFVFQFESSYACPLGIADCTFSGKDEKFDLSTLRKESGNWLFKSNDSTFYINVCKSLNPISNAKCSDGPVGVCQIHNNGESLNLGMVADGPKLEGDVLSIKYTGGSKCSTGKRYSSVIRFVCSKTLRGPYLIEQLDCQKIFEWLTPSACPNLVNEGNECKVYGPRTGASFDMGNLHSEVDYSLPSGNLTFSINLCGSLINPCNNKSNVSVCMKLQNESKEIAIGYTRNILKYFNGRLTFDLKGDECLPGKKSEVTVLLHCHHQAFLNNSLPELLSVVHNDCKFVFLWYLKLACQPFKEYDCKIQDGNILYDLTSLSNPSSNHVTTSKSQNRSFIYYINVCRPVVSSFDSICQYQSGVCQVNNLEADVTKRYLNLGDVTNTSLKVENGSVIIDYDYGSLCQYGSHYSTRIFLYCDKNANDTNPIFIREDKCNFTFSWRTKAACPVSVEHDDHPIIQENGNCRAVNPSSGQIFDLITSLDKTNAVINVDGNTIMVGICQTIPSEKCSTGSGACLLSSATTISYGNGNSNLQYDNGIYFLNYTDGDVCQNGVRRSTIIKFICASNISLVSHVEIEIDNCSLTVYWFTNSVCQERINCITYGKEKVVDLSPLANNDSNYITSDNGGTEFFINVCHPIAPTTKIKCISGSSLCAAYRQKDGTIKVQNLGFALSPPEIENNGDIVLKYRKGSQCNSFETSSSIHLKCNTSVGMGHPVFDGIINKCEYKFIWETNVICDGIYSRPNVSNSCLLTDPKLNVSIDISMLNKEIHKVKGWTRNFTISICNESKLECASEICKLQDQNWLPCGKRKLVEFDHNSSAVKLIYQDEVSGSSSTAEIWLVCNLTAGSGTPQQIYESDNIPIFEWQTDVVCNNGNFSPESSGINKTAITIVAVVSILALFLIATIIMIMKRTQIRNSVCFVLFRRYRSNYAYSRHESCEEDSVLMTNLIQSTILIDSQEENNYPKKYM